MQQRTPLDILKEQNQLRKRKREKSLLAVLQDVNEENRKQRQRDKLLDFHRQPLKQKHGTLIIGVKCKDGIVIASDRKVDRGGETEYSNKVFEFSLVGPVLFAAEGLTGIRDDFFLLLEMEVLRRKGVDSLYEVKIIVEDIIANLTERYAGRVNESSPIGVLMAGLRGLTKGVATLYYVHAPGYGEEVSFMCTGHGGQYAYTLAKFLFDPSIQTNICINEAVNRMGFVIAWVGEDVDSTVGGIPQIAILRNDSLKTETVPDEVLIALQQTMHEKRSRLPELLGLTLLT
jgi:20S proteasome alpha/beta subunit